MADFLKIDLDQHNQPATVRLCDKVTTITQAYFDKSGATITRFGIDKKPKSFYLTAEELDHLCAAASEYEGRVMQHTVTIAERKEAAIAEAKALAKSASFDLDSLNVRGKRDGDTWTVVVRALGFEQTCYVESLKSTVQEALDHIKDDVEYAERAGWNDGEWGKIVASYRRVFPLEPAEITEAKRLFTEAGFVLTDLTFTPGSEPGTWDFHGPFGGEGEIYMPNETPAQLLTDVKEYLDRKKTDAILDQMDAQQGEPEEKSFEILETMRKDIEPAEITQARELLKEALHPVDWTLCAMYPGTTNDCWSFDNGLEGNAHVAFLNKPAAELLELVSQYITETKREQGESDEMIAGFWARYRFTTEQAPEPITALPE